MVEPKILASEEKATTTIKMYVGICLGDVSFTRKQYITNTSLVINNSDLNYEHGVKLTQALTYPSAPVHF